MIKNIIKIKIVARGTTLKAFGRKKRNFRQVRKNVSGPITSFSRYNNIDNNVIEQCNSR
jgi:hypothetical protein